MVLTHGNLPNSRGRRLARMLLQLGAARPLDSGSKLGVVSGTQTSCALSQLLQEAGNQSMNRKAA